MWIIGLCLTLLAGAAFLWMLAKNITTPSATRSESWKRKLGRSVVPMIAVILLLRTFVIQPFWMTTDAAAPEIHRGSIVVVWKLSRTFTPNELIAYIDDGHVNIGRIAETGNVSVVVSRSPTSIVASRRVANPVSIQCSSIIGKVVSVLWRGAPWAPGKNALTPPISNPTDELKIEQSSNGCPAQIKDIKLGKGFVTFQAQAAQRTLNPEPWMQTHIVFHSSYQEADAVFEAPEIGGQQRYKLAVQTQGNRLTLLKIAENDAWHCQITFPGDAWAALGLGSQEALPYTHIATIKEFTIRFDPEKRDVSESHVAAFHLPPGTYTLCCKWNDAHPDVAHEGEWTGELETGELDFKVTGGGDTEVKKTSQQTRNPNNNPPAAASEYVTATIAKDGSLSYVGSMNVADAAQVIVSREAWHDLAGVVAASRGLQDWAAEDLIAWGEARDGLRTGVLMVSRAKSGEPHPGRLVIRNVSTESITVNLSPVLNRIDADALAADSTRLRVHKVVLFGTDPALTFTFKPGEQLEFAAPPVQFGVERNADGEVRTPGFPICGVETGPGTVGVRFSMTNVHAPGSGEVKIANE